MEEADASSERKYKINTRLDNSRSESKRWNKGDRLYMAL